MANPGQLPTPFNFQRVMADREQERAEGTAAVATRELEDDADAWLWDEDDNRIDDEDSSVPVAEDQEEDAADATDTAGLQASAAPPSEEERKAAASRLQRFDPGDRREVEELADSNDEDIAAEAELRLAEMQERGAFVNVYTPDLQQQLADVNQEARYLSDDIDRAKGLREKAELTERYVEAVKQIPRIEAELKARAIDAQNEAAFQQQAEAEVRRLMTEEKQERLRKAKGELTLEEQVKGAKPPRRLSEPKIAQLAWEAAQELDEAEVKKQARQYAAARRLEHRREVAKFYKEQAAADEAAHRNIIEIKLPT